MVVFKAFTEEFKLARVFIADWMAAYAPLKLKLPLWRPANAYARVLFAASKLVVKPVVWGGVPYVIVVRVWVALVTAVWIVVRLLYSLYMEDPA